MLPILICSSDNGNLNVYKEIVSAYKELNNANDINIICATDNPEKLIDLVMIRNDLSMYYLDVWENGWSNSRLIEVIREYDPRAYIVTISSSNAREHMETLAAIDKNTPDIIEQLYSALDKAYKLHKKVMSWLHDEKCLQLSADQDIVVIPQRDIYYITSTKKSHGVEIYTERESFLSRCSLETITKELGASFIKCHRSTIVNMAHVIGIDRKKMLIELDNGAIVPCSRRSVNVLFIRKR